MGAPLLALFEKGAFPNASPLGSYAAGGRTFIFRTSQSLITAENDSVGSMRRPRLLIWGGAALHRCGTPGHQRRIGKAMVSSWRSGTSLLPKNCHPEQSEGPAFARSRPKGAPPCALCRVRHINVESITRFVLKPRLKQIGGAPLLVPFEKGDIPSASLLGS